MLPSGSNIRVEDQISVSDAFTEPSMVQSTSHRGILVLSPPLLLTRDSAPLPSYCGHGDLKENRDLCQSGPGGRLCRLLWSLNETRLSPQQSCLSPRQTVKDRVRTSLSLRRSEELPLGRVHHPIVYQQYELQSQHTVADSSL